MALPSFVLWVAASAAAPSSAVVAPQPSPTPSQQALYDLLKLRHAPADLCQQLCAQETECNFFTYFYGDIPANCYLHINCSEYQNCEACLSGPTQPSFSSCQETTTGQ